MRTYKRRFYIRTFGCAHNQADSAMMAGQMVASGYEEVASADEADIIIINSCTVKDPSQKRFFYEAEMLRKRKLVVVAGCVPQGDPKNPMLEPYPVVGTRQIHKVADVVEEALKGKITKDFNKRPDNPPLNLPVRRKNPLIEIIPVNNGCLGKCSYCKTKHSRGHLTSYYPEEIITKAKKALDEGVRELWLTSEDLGAYGRDIGTDLADLAWEILNIKGDFRVRLGMANPPLIKDQIGRLIRVLKHPKCYKFIHIPVQSGSDRILDLMRRDYTAKEFDELVCFLKSKVPKISIATDIITGFPGETDEDHQLTMALLKKHQFPVINVSKFYARPGTPAARMKQVPTKVVKERTLEIHEWYNMLFPYNELKGSIQNVLFTERRGAYKVGRTQNYIEVSVPANIVSLGKSYFVRIKEASRWCLKGDEIIRHSVNDS